MQPPFRLFRDLTFAGLALVVFSSDSHAGACVSSCGGGDAKIVLRNIAVDTFKAISKTSNSGQIQFEEKHCSSLKVDDLSEPFYAALERNDIQFVHSKDDSECLLQDDSGDCPEFLTDRSSPDRSKWTLKVDIDRMIRHLSPSNHDQNENYQQIQARLIHESYWFSQPEKKDWLSQCSRELSNKVQAAPDSKTIDLLMRIVTADQKEVPCLKTGDPGSGTAEKLAADAQQAVKQLPPEEDTFEKDEEIYNGLLDSKVTAKLSDGRYKVEGPMGETEYSAPRWLFHQQGCLDDKSFCVGDRVVTSRQIEGQVVGLNRSRKKLLVVTSHSLYGHPDRFDPKELVKEQ